MQAYKDIHFTDVDIKLNEGRTKEEMVEFLTRVGISSNYNEPMTKEQINRLSEDNLKKIIKNIAITHNLVNIQQVKGEDLEISDTDKYDYILCYSFPCQDLSLAGKRALMSDTTTRSGMLWEVERILSECKELGTLPQILLMENVIQVHGEGAVKDFNKWQLRLEELGYKNYWQDLIATDYGIPQIRNRCFMISILGDYSYTFPKPMPLKLKLKDMLEDKVDEKYYLSDDLMQHIQKTAEEHEEYTQFDRYNGNLEMWCRVWKDKSPTLNTNCKDTKIYVKNATKKYYLEATNGDKIENYSCLDLSQMRREGKPREYKKAFPTLSARDYKEPKLVKLNDLRVRKLIPCECFALMGVKREDYEKVAKNQSDSSLYHLAGDSIVVDVLCHIFEQLIKKESE